MSIKQQLDSYLYDNPLLRREHLSLVRQRAKWFWRIFYGFLVLFMLAPLLSAGAEYYGSWFSFWTGVLLLCNVVLYVGLGIRAIGFANETIQKERGGKTWDLLILTGVGAWRLVWGKWLAVMRFLARDYFALFILRIVTFFWLMAGMNRSYSSSEFSDLNFSLPNFTHWLVLAIALFTLLELALNTALGLASALFNVRSRTSTSIGLGFRVFLGIGVWLILFITGFILRPNLNNISIDPHVAEFGVSFISIFGDNGMLSLLSFTSNSRYMDSMYWTPTLLALGLGAGAYLLMTGFSLELARSLANRRGLNPDMHIIEKSKKKKDALVTSPVTVATAPSTISHPETLNPFALPHAESLHAEIYEYQARVGRLLLRLSNDNEVYYLQFSNVLYVEAPRRWLGANFESASPSDYAAFLAEKGIVPNSLLEKNLLLYTLKGATPVRFLAGTVKVLEQMPKAL